MSIIVFLSWVLLGAGLWVRAMKVYGPNRMFDLEDWTEEGNMRMMSADISPGLRLFLHVLLAPIYLVAILGRLFVVKVLFRLGRLATEFGARIHDVGTRLHERKSE